MANSFANNLECFLWGILANLNNCFPYTHVHVCVHTHTALRFSAFGGKQNRTHECNKAVSVP